MATIGSFSYDEANNTYKGRIKTVALTVNAVLVPNEKRTSDDAPLYRVKAARNGAELGAAWQKYAKDTDEPYLSLKIDDPSFPAPIYANLVQVEGEPDYQLIWSRPNAG